MIQNQLLSFIVMMFLTTSFTSESLGMLRDFAAQPLVSGTFAMTWDATGATGEAQLLRRIGQDEYKPVGTVALDRQQYIDRCPVRLKTGVSVSYRMMKEGQPVGYAQSINSSELILQGNFELPPGPAPAFVGFSINCPAPWSAAIVSSGMEDQGYCLAFSTSDPDANATFSLSSRWFIISPRSTYRFGWWVTQETYGTSTIEGNAYGMTKEKTKSFYEKTANLYVYPGTAQGEWVGTSSEPNLSKDLRYVYIVLRGQGSKHPKPIQVDKISIFDKDFELLIKTDVPQLVNWSRLAAQRLPGLGLQEQITHLTSIIEGRLKAMSEVTSQDIDTFLDQRADLCEAVRELNRLMIVFRLAEMEP